MPNSGIRPHDASRPSFTRADCRPPVSICITMDQEPTQMILGDMTHDTSRTKCPKRKNIAQIVFCQSLATDNSTSSISSKSWLPAWMSRCKDNSFDTVVDTFGICSFEQPVQVCCSHSRPWIWHRSKVGGCDVVTMETWSVYALHLVIAAESWMNPLRYSHGLTRICDGKGWYRKVTGGDWNHHATCCNNPNTCVHVQHVPWLCDAF